MSKKRIGPIPIYNPDRACFDFDDLPIYDVDEFIGLQLRWRDTNTLASFDEKEAEWSRLVHNIRLRTMYEWKDEYIHTWFQTNGKMYLPARIYNRLMRSVNV